MLKLRLKKFNSFSNFQKKKIKFSFKNLTRNQFNSKKGVDVGNLKEDIVQITIRELCGVAPYF